MSAIFGPAGNSESFAALKKPSTFAPGWLRGLGLDAYEYQCGKGVNVGEQTARDIGTAAKEHGIALSLHAPYFISLSNPDPATQENSRRYILASCQAADWMGATRVIVHMGAVMKRDRAEAMAVQAAALREVLRVCDDAGFGHIALCPETMGKINQLGTLDEVLDICTIDARLVPCIDFGHLYARSLGEMTGPDAMEGVLNRIEAVLGPTRAARFHSHFSKIEFTPGGGERRHLTFDQQEFGPDFTPLAAAVAARGWSPTFICESAGTQAEDALAMKAVYQTYLQEAAP